MSVWGFRHFFFLKFSTYSNITGRARRKNKGGVKQKYMKDNNQKLAIYVRDSMNNKKSINEQKNTGIQIAKQLNVDYDVFIEKDKNKPILKDVMSSCKEGKYYAVFAVDTSRISRDAFELLSVTEFLLKHNVVLLTGTTVERLKEFDEADRFYLQILQVINENKPNSKNQKI